MTIVNNAAYEIPDFYVGVLEANIDMSVASTYQYSGVAVGAASGAGLTGPAALIAPVSSGANILGVLQNNPQLAEAGTVMCRGISKVQASASFAPGVILAVTAAGQFKTALTGDYGVALSLQTGASGSIVSVYLENYGKQ